MSSHEREVVVVGVKIPFWSLVGFLIKLALASIPATIIVTLIVWMVVGLFLAPALVSGVGGLAEGVGQLIDRPLPY